MKGISGSQRMLSLFREMKKKISKKMCSELHKIFSFKISYEVCFDTNVMNLRKEIKKYLRS